MVTRPRHALLASVIAHVFEAIDVGLTLWEKGRWREVYERPDSRDLMGFEAEHGIEGERIAYNTRCMLQARRTNRTVVAEHMGFADLFVPVCWGGLVDTVLVTGPVARQRATSTDILERWRALTSRQGHPADPEFSHYVAATLSVAVLGGADFASFQRLAECVARLIVCKGSAATLYREIESLGARLADTRLADRMWSIARTMVDERTSRRWASPTREARIRTVGLTRFPEQALVGLFVSRSKDADPVDELLRRDAFQRACVRVARDRGNVICGQIGGHGIVLLSAGRGSPAHTRRFLLDLGDEVSSLARRRFGLSLHLGLAAGPGSLVEQYQAALAAAEQALSRDVRLSKDPDRPVTNPLGPLRQELAKLVAENPEALPARFDRYLEVVLVRSGYRLDPARAHLEAAFERIVEASLGLETVGAKSLSDLQAATEQASGKAATLAELFAVYRVGVSDVVTAILTPALAPRDRSLRRAEEYMRKHFSERLTLSKVARIAGFAPTHFSRLFHAQQKLTFERYLMRLRIERAQQLLSGTTLNLQRVAQLSGFSTGSYFGAAFRRCTGETAIAYRQRLRRQRGPAVFHG
jgi:AraC-like DNA-binding protein